MMIRMRRHWRRARIMRCGRVGGARCGSACGTAKDSARQPRLLRAAAAVVVAVMMMMLDEGAHGSAMGTAVAAPTNNQCRSATANRSGRQRRVRERRMHGPLRFGSVAHGPRHATRPLDRRRPTAGTAIAVAADHSPFPASPVSSSTVLQCPAVPGTGQGTFVHPNVLAAARRADRQVIAPSTLHRLLMQPALAPRISFAAAQVHSPADDARNRVGSPAQ